MKYRIIFAITAVSLVGATGCNRQHGGTATTTTTGAPASAALDPGFVTGSRGANTAAPVMPGATDIPAGTTLRVRLGDELDTRRCRPGSPFVAYLDDPILSGDRVLLPKGTEFQGHVVEAHRSGRLKGRASLEMALDSFQLRGTVYQISTSAAGRVSGRHLKRNVAIIGGSSGAGAAIGAAAGGGVGALIGAGAGAAAGTTGAIITGKKDVRLPAETRVQFSLRTSIEVHG